MLSRVYRNLNKGGLSIKTKTDDGRWIVTDYCASVVMRNCTFRVSQAERKRIASGGHRSIHAWIEGEIVSQSATDYAASTAPIPYYNPHKTECFEIDLKPVTRCAECRVYSPPRAKK